MSVGTVRWRAVRPLAICGALGLGAWILFADRVAKHAVESVGTTLIGASVEIRRLHLDLPHGRVEVRGLTVASPFAALQNLLEADELVADVDPLPLLEKKVVIDRLAAKGLRFGTPRQTDGRTVGQSDGVRGQVERWTAQLHVPVLQFATGKIDVSQLDLSTLSTPAAAQSLAAQVDSVRTAWNGGLQGLGVAATVDSAKQMTDRLRGAKPTDLRLLGDARRTLDQVKRTRAGLAGLERGVHAGTELLQAGVAGLAAARQRDYATARALLRLPTLDAPQIGAALFGSEATERFRRALYWAELGRRYMPPGLRPSATPGPQRTRRAGVTARFPRERAYPAFLLRAAELSFELGGGGGAPRTYAAHLAGLTSDPTLYGRATTLEASAPGVRAAALVDHVRPTPRDTAAASVSGVTLSGFALPSLPIRLEPGQGTVSLSLALVGDSVQARWSMRSERVHWVRDSATARSQLGDIVWRVVSGVSTVDVSASLGGTLARPRLAVGSNLDGVLAQRIRALAGEASAGAERQLRARVDSLVERQAAPVRAQVATLTTEVTQRLSGQQALLDQAQRALEQRLRELTTIPGVRLP